MNEGRPVSWNLLEMRRLASVDVKIIVIASSGYLLSYTALSRPVKASQYGVTPSG